MYFYVFGMCAFWCYGASNQGNSIHRGYLKNVLLFQLVLCFKVLQDQKINPFVFAFKDVIKDFERNISDMISAFVEHVQGVYPLIV